MNTVISMAVRMEVVQALGQHYRRPVDFGWNEEEGEWVVHAMGNPMDVIEGPNNSDLENSYQVSEEVEVLLDSHDDIQRSLLDLQQGEPYQPNR